MENKITLGRLTNFIKTKTDLTIANFEYNESSIDSKNIIIIQANYDYESYNAICDNNAESLLNLIVKIFTADRQDDYVFQYLIGLHSELNALSDLHDELDGVIDKLSVDELKEKIVDAILKDKNG